jgi:hypothetical protein
VTPPARSGAASFELRRFEAAPVTGAIVVLEVEGRFRESTRFGRPPVLVIEPGEEAGRRRIELQPVRTSSDGPRWNASYAVPAEALTADARLALGIRGTLLELPAPDEPDDGERLTALAREANALRRRLETAEADAATARDEAAATTADRDAAVTTAREAAEAVAAERISALELEVGEARRLAASDAETARTAAAATLAEATARAAELESSLRTAEESLRAAEQRATDAEARAVEVEESLRVAEAAVAEAQEQATAEIDAPLTTEMASVIDAEARASDAERELRVAREGIAVLRAELAEERERSQAMVDEDATRVVAPRDEDETRVAPSRAEDETRVLRPAFGADEDDTTQAFSVTDEADATADPPARPLERQGVPHPPAQARSGGVWIGRWVALAALVLFAIVLIALLFGL